MRSSGPRCGRSARGTRSYPSNLTQRMEKVPTMRFTAQQHLKAAAMVPDRELKDLLRTTARLAHQSAAPKVPGTLPTAKASSPFPRQPARDQLAQLGHPLKNALQGRVSLMG